MLKFRKVKKFSMCKMHPSQSSKKENTGSKDWELRIENDSSPAGRYVCAHARPSKGKAGAAECQPPLITSHDKTGFTKETSDNPPVTHCQALIPPDTGSTASCPGAQVKEAWGVTRGVAGAGTGSPRCHSEVLTRCGPSEGCLCWRQSGGW